jgi:alcohol dehydrogenase YqhD (iron-dependent ADH family)
MQNYIYYNPTRLYFGHDQIEAHLGEETKKRGTHAIILYGRGSIKKNGLYDRVVQCLKDAGIAYSEYAGIEPNPQYTTVNRAAKVCRDNHCDVVIAIGGGSVIDTAKLVCQANFYEGDCWDLVTQKIKEERGLDLIAIPTIASAGSENDAWSVISNADTKQKLDPWHIHFQPVAAFIDPVVTYSVSRYQTAIGAADTLSHITDIRYFIKEHKIEFVDQMMEAMARAVIKYGPIACEDPTNERARENLSWAATLITGGMMDQGGRTDMILHLAEYGIAAFYEIPHGHGVGLMMPRWMQYVLGDETAPIFYRFGVACMKIDEGLEVREGAQRTIDAMNDWMFHKLGLESHLANLGVDEAMLPEMALKATAPHGGVLHGITDLTTKDIENIYRLCM